LLLTSRPSNAEVNTAEADADTRKFKQFADKALYYGFNTAKVGAAVGLFALVLTLTERVARWAWRTVRGSFNYWREEIKDLKNGGMDSDQLALEKDEFVNDTEGWESPLIEKRSRYIIQWGTEGEGRL
jgi:hypothetical protein